MFPISMGNPGTEYKVVKVTGSQHVRHFLENLGFVEGAAVEVISSMNGDVIINIKDSRVAVNEDMAKHIMVQ